MSPRSRETTGLKALRLTRGLTQEALAGHAGITRQAYGAIESGASRPSVDVALRLARVLGTTVEDAFAPPEGPAREIVAVMAGGPWPAGPARVRLARVAGRVVAHRADAGGGAGMGFGRADGVAHPAGGGEVRARMLAQGPTAWPDLVVFGCDPAFALVADAVRRERGIEVLWVRAGSRASLDAVARGEAHLAGVHLLHPESGSYNHSWAAALVPGDTTLVRFATWQQTLLLAHGNPLGLGGVADLTGSAVRFVNREAGSGSRALLDRCLAEVGVPASAVPGYDRTRARGHLDVAAAVASGAADAGVGIRAAGDLYGLESLPLAEEPYDFVIPSRFLDLPAVQALLDTLAQRSLQRQIAALGGYDIAEMGLPA